MCTNAKCQKTGIDSHDKEVCQQGSSATGRNDLLRGTAVVTRCLSYYKRDDSGKLKKNLICHARVHSTKIYGCGDCKERFSELESLKAHRLIHSSEKPSKCGLCGKTFAKQIPVNHYRTCHAYYECNNCGKTFSRQKQLNYHKMNYQGREHYTCKVCGKTFVHQKSLNHHNKVNHLDNGRYRCGDCGRTFYKRYLKKHIKIHTGGKPHRRKV